MCVIRTSFSGEGLQRNPHVSQGKRNHNIRGVRLDCGSEVLQEYRLKYDEAFKIWKL